MNKLSSGKLPLSIEFISTEQGLRDVLDHCAGLAVLGVDTEFVRYKTYYPILGLIQLSDGEKCFLIDPLALRDLSSLKALMVNKNVTKVFHSCSEDLEVFDHHMGCSPDPVFDTQIISAILGLGFSLSYQNLVMQLTGDHLPKEETRSDWLQRPLSQSQCQYAALDVAYLPQIYQQQCQALDVSGKLTWAQEECGRLTGNTAINAASENYYLKSKSAWKLDRQQLNVLKSLCAWREEEARHRDLPRSRVVEDKVLYSIARSSPDTKLDFAELNMFPGKIRKYGEVLINLYKKAINEDESLYPSLVERPAPPSSSGLLKELKQLVEEKAEELGCAAEILAKKKDLQELLRSQNKEGIYGLTEVFSGWRKQAIGEALLAKLNKD